MRVLIIDDEASIRRITAVTLEVMGHETADAENGAVALEQLAATHFDAAFLDLRLENENGIELLPRLLETSPGLGVVMFSGQATRENAAAARHAGATDLISKPFTPDEIRSVLGKLAVETAGVNGNGGH